jgi:uncharacterized protein with GYD domain
MPKYLIQASYVGEGVKGLLKDGGTKRRAAAEAAAKSLGGSVESFYFAFGDTDAFVVVDLPDNVAMSALALTVGATGMVRSKTTVLLTPEEVDKVVQKTATYRAPGQ